MPAVPPSPQGSVVGSRAPSVTGSITPSAVGTIVTGDYAVGDRVISLVPFKGASGSVEKGDVGFVVGEPKGLSEKKREGRLNCRFPKHQNVNFKVTQIRKVESPNEGSGGGGSDRT